MTEKLTKILIPLAIVIAGLLIAGAFVYINSAGSEGTAAEKSSLAQQIAEKAIKYINDNPDLTGGNTASLISVLEDGSVYKIRLKIGEQEYDSYVSKDGKLLFPNAYNIEEQAATETTPDSGTQEGGKTCEDLKKSDDSLLEAFVVSQCPYGLQMQRILDEVVKNIPSLADNIKVKYIGAVEGDKITSMHGDEEAQENLRQICIREEQADKYWGYVGCYMQKGDSSGCLSSVDVDTQKLNNCMEDTSKGLKYAKEDFDSQDQYQVTGSPTLFLNGEKVSEFDFGGRTAEALKTLLCCGSNTQPDACSQKLTETQAATGFSTTYSQGAGSSGGSCN